MAKKDECHCGEFSCPDALKQFQRAAQKFTKRATRSRNAARQALYEAGILTKNGRLRRRYQ